jgi:hypothetical protein
VEPRAGLDDVEKRKFLTLPGLELDPSVVQPVASRYTDYAIAILKLYISWISSVSTGKCRDRTTNWTKPRISISFPIYYAASAHFSLRASQRLGLIRRPVSNASALYCYAFIHRRRDISCHLLMARY